jgi:hypothetical protein
MKNCKYILIFISILLSCTHKEPVRKALYIWNSDLHLSQIETNELQKQDIKKLYIHMFDVVWNKQTQSVTPTAKVSCNTLFPNTFTIIPTIYITVESLQKTTLLNIPNLAHKIFTECSTLCKINNLQFSEIQIDCDWTPSTKRSFFLLLQTLSDTLHATNKNLSATIRLHQIKYYKKTGIPPVDRGMLMFYNMGTITCNSEKNSIYNKEDAQKYTDFIRNYPLELDIALPLFSWGVVCNNNHVKLLVNTIDDFLKKHRPNLIQSKNNEYISRKSFLYKGMYITKGDVITIEKITPEECKDAADFLAENLNLKKQRTISLFDYSSIRKEKYEINSLQDIYNQFN